VSRLALLFGHQTLASDPHWVCRFLPNLLRMWVGHYPLEDLAKFLAIAQREK